MDSDSNYFAQIAVILIFNLNSFLLEIIKIIVIDTIDTVFELAMGPTITDVSWTYPYKKCQRWYFFL